MHYKRNCKNLYLFGHPRGAVEAFRNCKGLSVILSKSYDAIEHFTKVRIFLISHSIIFLNPEIKELLFLRKLAKNGDEYVKK